jgi:hypothetical protein
VKPKGSTEPCLRNTVLYFWHRRDLAMEEGIELAMDTARHRRDEEYRGGGRVTGRDNRWKHPLTRDTFLTNTACADVPKRTLITIFTLTTCNLTRVKNTHPKRRSPKAADAYHSTNDWREGKWRHWVRVSCNTTCPIVDYKRGARQWTRIARAVTRTDEVRMCAIIRWVSERGAVWLQEGTNTRTR